MRSKYKIATTFAEKDFVSLRFLSALKNTKVVITKREKFKYPLSISFSNISIIDFSIPITLPKTKFLCGNLANLPDEKPTGVIYNTFPLRACTANVGLGYILLTSPSINWSAFGQALFQKAYFKGELFGKERRFQKVSPKKQTQGEMRK